MEKEREGREGGSEERRGKRMYVHVHVHKKSRES